MVEQSASRDGDGGRRSDGVAVRRFPPNVIGVTIPPATAMTKTSAAAALVGDCVVGARRSRATRRARWPILVSRSSASYSECRICASPDAARCRGCERVLSHLVWKWGELDEHWA